MNDTKRQLKGVLARIRARPEWNEQLPDDCDIVNDLALDSIEMLQFMLEVESALERTIDFERLEYFHLHSLERFAAFLDGVPSEGRLAER